MKSFTLSLLSFFSLTYAATSQAFPELPFCPAGGPPGWYNHFTKNHNHNHWRSYNGYTTPQPFPPVYTQPQWQSPVYPPVTQQGVPAVNNRYYPNQRR